MSERGDFPDDGRCKAAVWRKDTYRRTGRGRSGFEMHYNEGRCKRRAVVGDLCRQHHNYNPNLTRARFADSLTDHETRRR